MTDSVGGMANEVTQQVFLEKEEEETRGTAF